MAGLRDPFQGVANIVRFNWHFYVLAALVLVLVWVANAALDNSFVVLSSLITAAICLPILISLIVSWYVYDHSGLYSLPWLRGVEVLPAPFILNIHAGLDEFSETLQVRYRTARLEVLDFYDPGRHTEVSIRRARKAYPPHPGTKAVSTSALPVADASADLIILALAAHEIRDDAERAAFFRELARVLKPDGRVVVTEHLRDLPNFLAYNIGAFHFLPRSSWYRVFGQGRLRLIREQSLTPFITTFTLGKHGAAS